LNLERLRLPLHGAGVDRQWSRRFAEWLGFQPKRVEGEDRGNRQQQYGCCDADPLQGLQKSTLS
jgi:hypothetical protein